MSALLLVLLLMIPQFVWGGTPTLKLKQSNNSWYAVPDEIEDSGDSLYRDHKIKRWKPKIKMQWGDHKILLRSRHRTFQIKYRYYFDLF